MQEKLSVGIGALRLTPMGVEAKGIAKIDGEEIALLICGQPHHLDPGMVWNESALICGCDEAKTREILEHPLMLARLAEAKAMLIEARKSELRGFLERLALVKVENPTTTSGQTPGCTVTMLEISTPDVTGAASESYVEAIGEAVIECDSGNLKASLYLSARFEENGEPVRNLFISEMTPDELSDEEAEAAGDAISAHAGVRDTLEQMRRDLIEAAKTSARQELTRLESIETAEALT